MVNPKIIEQLLTLNPTCTRRTMFGGLLLAVLGVANTAQASRGRCDDSGLIINSDLEVDPNILVGRTAPPFSQQDVNLNSSTYQSYLGPQDYLGKVIVLNFGDLSFCQPCREELPYLQSVQQSFGNEVALLFFETGSLSYRRSPSEAYFEMQRVLMTEASLNLADLTFPILSDQGRAPRNFCMEESNGGRYFEHFNYRTGQTDDAMGAIISRNFYGVSAVPATFIIDRTGRIRTYHTGTFEPDQLPELIRSCL